MEQVRDNQKSALKKTFKYKIATLSPAMLLLGRGTLRCLYISSSGNFSVIV
jgi:hypothetical protein